MASEWGWMKEWICKEMSIVLSWIRGGKLREREEKRETKEELTWYERKADEYSEKKWKKIDIEKRGDIKMTKYIC